MGNTACCGGARGKGMGNFNKEDLDIKI